MPSKSNDQAYAGIFSFSSSKSFFTQSRSKSQQVVNITPPIQPIQRSNTTSNTTNTEIEDKIESIQRASTVDSRDSNSPPPIVIPTRTSSKTFKRSSSRHRYSQSISNTVDLSSLRRSVSLRSVSSPQGRHYRQASAATLVASTSNDSLSHHYHKLSIPKLGPRNTSSENFKEEEFESDIEAEKRDMLNSTMTTVQYRNPPPGRPPTSHSASHSSMNNLNYSSINNGTPAPQQAIPNLGPGTQNPSIIYHHIMDTASKRISTLDYLRKAHEGRVYWFNTLLFTKPDLLKFPYFQPSKLARRATNYLLLGFSLPTILDLNSQTATEYLRALNALLAEFDQYQTLHPPDGSTGTSLSRARIPHMFKRTTGKNRRASSAADLMMGGQIDESTFLPGANDATHNQEQYTHLLTPSLPFDPDFFETFATLCDVLIDCYTKVTQLIHSPDVCVGGVGELFAKADARIKKVIVQGVVREFEERCREGVKSEVAGVGKVVLGGLM
ncbi:hypothetical protein E2P81_ATG01645 [Venturia nashicola]|uniref:Uncharacterized protein n=1 Tax=Venturia nashicola TaxID=86259 RepID=A0A4Z1P1X9_9PEZI|nr:hypothetical protein E6O75_ATG01686 [Venturia nashicola]TLD18917.1 hypothetical protein E2P81_ATG01645 [Venturia nashicola]